MAKQPAKKLPPLPNKPQAAAAPSTVRVIYSGSSEADLLDILAEQPIGGLLLIVPHRDSEIVVNGKTHAANSRAIVPITNAEALRVISGSVTAIALPGTANPAAQEPITAPDIGEDDIAEGITGSTLNAGTKIEMRHATAENTIPTKMLDGFLVGILSGVLYASEGDYAPAISHPTGLFFAAQQGKKYFTKADDCTLLLIPNG